MNKSNFPCIMKEVYNTHVYQKHVIRKLNINFFKTFWTQIRLMLSKRMHSRTKKTRGHEKKDQNINARYILGEGTKFHETCMTY